jgi:hypothetical protein
MLTAATGMHFSFLSDIIISPLAIIHFFLSFFLNTYGA